MTKVLSALTAMLAVAGGLSAAAPKTKVKIALIVAATVDDHGWCQAMNDAILAEQKKYPGKIDYIKSEKMNPTDAGAAAQRFAADHCDLVILHGSQYGSQTKDAAMAFPGTTFVQGTSDKIVGANVFTYMPESEQTGYLNGIIAGMVTTSGQVGIVGPKDLGDAARYDRGFKLGALAANPKVQVKIGYTNDFSDVIKSAELAQAHINAGADFLTGSAQQAMGALRAVAGRKDKTIWWVGQDFAQLNGPEAVRVIAASSYDYTKVLEILFDKHNQGVKGGENIPLTFGNQGFDYRFNDKVGKVLTPAIKKAVNQAKADLASGKLTVAYKDVKF
jgi:basic membrane protein A